jgi:hydroxypyruvate isomerase
MPLRQSFCWWTFAGRGIPDTELLQKAKAIGYEAVELIGEEHFDRARDLGFVIASHNSHQSIDQGWNDFSQHPRLEAELHAGLALAQKHHIPNLIVFSGSRRAGLSDDAGLENTARGLARMARAAEDANVTLILELLNSKRDHPGYQCDRTAWGVEVCRRAASPRVKLLYDIYHMQVMEGDLIRTIEASHAAFGHYHTAGNPGRQDLDAFQEIAYPPIFRAIAATGYTGFVGHEFVPKGNPIAALQAAYDLCRHSLSD